MLQVSSRQATTSTNNYHPEVAQHRNTSFIKIIFFVRKIHMDAWPVI